MARFTWSLKVKASAAAAALFLAGLATAGALSYIAMNTVAEQSDENQTSRAVEEALETLKEVRTRMAGYANILARNPDLAATVKRRDPAMLEAFFVREFKALKAADPTVATLEATDASGVVIIRGHNPAKKRR